ncbi:MAG: cyclodeaminase/cyclohydrolase family protein [Firmicutes bacterium]|nr:cyclodeaminase/cyclohydrolase family protein [Bacillota bacterium]
MLGYLNWSVEELFQKAASPAPEPGGGGVSAMTGCLGTGMLSMVARITLGKEKYKDVETEISGLITTLDRNIETLKSLAQRDMDAFHGFMEALAMPRNTPEEKALREEKKQQAALLSAGVPLEIAGTCLSGLKAANSLAAIGAKLAISDVGVGAHLLEAALKGALMMVDANLVYINDLEKVKNIIAEKEQLILEAEEISRSTLTSVRGRMKE